MKWENDKNPNIGYWVNVACKIGFHESFTLMMLATFHPTRYRMVQQQKGGERRNEKLNATPYSIEGSFAISTWWIQKAKNFEYCKH